MLRLAMILCLVAASSEPLQLQTDSPAAKNLAEIRKQIAGREQEPAENVFKNIELLKGRPAARLPDMMRALTGLLGVECTFCHVEGRWESEENARLRLVSA